MKIKPLDFVNSSFSKDSKPFDEEKPNEKFKGVEGKKKGILKQKMTPKELKKLYLKKMLEKSDHKREVGQIIEPIRSGDQS